MADYEYTVIPAPMRGEKVRGARTPSERFAPALAAALNGMAAQGWEYVRAETLPSEERSGLTSRTTVWHNLLVFRRPVASAGAEAAAAAARPPATGEADAPAADRLAEADGAPVTEPPAESPADPSTSPTTAAAGGPAFQPMRAGPRGTEGD